MHPIESMMTTAMEQIKQMVDVNTIIGDPVQTRQGKVILPISKVSLGFVAGGGEYGKGGSIRESNKDATENPFAGGSGAGICISPVAFMVVEDETVRLMPVESNHAMERVSEAIPQLIGLIKHFGCKGKGQKQGQTKEECCTETVEQKPCGDEDITYKQTVSVTKTESE